MCIGKDFCVELGTDTIKWSKESPLKRPEWFESQIDLFIEAVSSFQEGDSETCLGIISQIRSEEIIDWYVEHGQMSGKHRSSGLGLEEPLEVPIEYRDPQRRSKKLELIVFQRDNYHCRYCGGRLIPTNFMSSFLTELNSDVFRNGRPNRDRHGIIHLTNPVADHVIPWRLGGKTSLENLVSSCGPCNYGKAGYSLEQLGLETPFNRPVIMDNWCESQIFD